MPVRGLTTSPVVRQLLSLAARRVDGQTRIGGHRLLFRGGRLLSVSASDAQGPTPFLLRSDLLTSSAVTKAREQSEDEGTGLIRALQAQALLPQDEVEATSVALFADRLWHGLKVHDEANAEPLVLEPLPEDIDAENVGTSAVRVILTALAYNAQGLAGSLICGSRTRIFAFVDSPHREEAVAWFDGNPPQDPRLFEQRLTHDPAYAARIVALLQANLGVLQAMPEPTSMDAATVLEGRLPAAVEGQQDTLSELERQISRLEEQGAPPEERAAAWRRIAREWRSVHHSPFEAARAYREAAAADPGDLASLEQAAELCRSMGAMDLALPYTRAAVRASGPDARGRSFGRLAALAIQAGDQKAAADAYRTAATHGFIDAPFHWLACARGAAPDMLSELRNAVLGPSAGAIPAPLRREVLAELVEALPADLDTWLGYANALVADDRPGAAIAFLRVASTWVFKKPSLARLRLHGAKLAEAHGFYSDAASLLREAFDADPENESLHSPLAADADALPSPAQKAVLLEAIARAAAPALKSYWLTLAADAFLEVVPDCLDGIELHVEALSLDPGAPRPLEALRDYADRTGDFGLLAMALESALRNAAAIPKEIVADLAVELALLAEEALSSPALALWARERKRSSEAPEGQPFAEERLRERELAIEEIGRQLRDGVDDPEQTRLRRLAVLLRDDPNRREEAIHAHRKLLTAMTDPHTARTLDRLLRSTENTSGRLELARSELLLAVDAPSRATVLRRIALLEAKLGRFANVAEACRTIVALQGPADPVAIARLEQSGRVLQNPAMLLEALHLACSETAGVPGLALMHDLIIASARTNETGVALDAALEAMQRYDPGPVAPISIFFCFFRHDDLDTAARGLMGGWMVQEFGPSGHLFRVTHAVGRDGLETLPPLVLEHLARAAPLDVSVAVAHLSAARREGDPERLQRALDHALECPATPGDALVRALETLAADPPDADTVLRSLHAVDRAGATRPELVAHMRRVCEAVPELRYRIAGLERAFLFQSREERMETLRELARLHQEARDRAAENRCYVRLLSLGVSEPALLERMTTLYAELAEPDRLRAVLALRLGHAESPAEHLERTLDLASVEATQGASVNAQLAIATHLAEYGVDPTEFLRVTSALAECGATEEAARHILERADAVSDREAGGLYLHLAALLDRYSTEPGRMLEVAAQGLRRCHGPAPLLVLFERACLEQDNHDEAVSLYDQLIEASRGPHGRRALMYRKARWLELAGFPEESLTIYLRAFELAPKSGAVFNAIDRLAHQTSAYQPLAEAMILRAEQMRTTLDKAMWLRGAAQLLEEPLQDPENAFWLLIAALRLLNDPQMADHARRLIHSACARSEDPRLLTEQMATQLAAVLEERLEQTWDQDERLTQLRRLAEIYGVELRNLKKAAALVDLILKEGTSGEHIASQVNALLWLAERLEADGEAREAQHRLRQAQDLVPSHPRIETQATQLADRAHDTRPMFRIPDDPLERSSAGPRQRSRDSATAIGWDALTIAPQVENGPKEAFGDGPAQRGEITEPLVGVAQRRSNRPSATSYAFGSIGAEGPSTARMRTLREALDEGNLEAGAELAAVLGRSELGLHEAKDILLSILAKDPGRPDLLRQLLAIAEQLSLAALRETCRELVALFDPEEKARTRAQALPALSAYLPPPAELLPSIGRSPWADVFRLLWEDARPLFRQPPPPESELRWLEGTHSLRIFHTRICDQLGVPTLKLARWRDPHPEPVTLVATDPPTLLLHPELLDDDASLPFFLARSTYLSRPEHIVLVRGANASNRVVTAVHAAFNPDGAAAQIPTEAVHLTTALWDTLAPRQQSHLQHLLRDNPMPTDHTELQAEVFRAAARAGLLFDGGVQSAVGSLRKIDAAADALGVPEHGPVAESEARFQAACEHSGALAAMVSFALSDTYLGARARLITSRRPKAPAP